MDLRKLITRSFFHYLRSNILAAGGLAVATAVITGAFIIGDSLSHSLERAVIMRLGGITHSITAGDRLFTIKMGDRFAEQSGMPVSRALVAEGMVIAEGGMDRLNRVQVIGSDNNFSKLLGSDIDYGAIAPGEVVISANMARRLQLEPGDYFMLRMKSAGVIPMNTPLVSDANQTVTRRVMVAAVAGDHDYGRFNMQVSQTAPFNIFVNIGWLNSVMGLNSMANALFVADENADSGILEEYMRSAFEPEDGNLIVRVRDDLDLIEISSERVFIEEHLSERLTETFPGATRVLTYFVNAIEKGDNVTPYSFIAATGQYGLGPGETVINSWLAGDLGADIGDTLIVRYFETGPRRELEERDVTLVVTGIIGIDQAVADSILMPFLPGMSDAGSCRDWDAGVPISLDRIRDADEDYWTAYRGTPKAYISLGEGQRLWTNRFGNLTSVWLPGSFGDLQAVRYSLGEAADPLQMGFQINPLRENGLEAAAGGVDFGMLFGGLGFFVMLAGVMLFFLLMLFNLERRSDQVRLFSSMGYTPSLIRKIYLGEGMLVAAAGGLGGLLLAAGYGELVRYALMEVWQDIVRTDLIVLVISPVSLLGGFAISLAIALLVTMFGINRYIVRNPAPPSPVTAEPKNDGSITIEGVPSKGISTAASANEIKESRGRVVSRIKTFGKAGKQPVFADRLTPMASLLFGAAGATVLLLQLLTGYDAGPAGFFISGGLLLVAVLLLARMLLIVIGNHGYDKINMMRLSIKNLARNRTRSFLVIILLALGMFVIIATGSFRKDAATAEMHPEGGTGGFLFVAESTVPVLYNLNSSDTRLDLNIPSEVEFVQFMASYADDASCLNLNEIANPRIIATDPSLLENRFSFARGTQWLDTGNPWESLNTVLPGGDQSRHRDNSHSGIAGPAEEMPAVDGRETDRPAITGGRASQPSGASMPVIPAIADQAVIQWGLNKRVGDTLFYTDERGREIGLLLIGGLANSIFQGNIIISEANFLNHFPSTSGSSFFLVDAARESEGELHEDLNFIFRDHGWEMVTADARLNEFNSVENTYLAIFMMLGALGVLLGVAGLAVVMARSIAERRTELALYASLGYTRLQITLIVLREYMLLLGCGLAVGVPPALIAIMPMLMPGSQQLNPGFLAVIVVAIFLHGLLWIAFTSLLMIKGEGLTRALRND